MFERRDVWLLSSEDPWHPIIRWYAQAITALKSRARTNPTKRSSHTITQLHTDAPILKGADYGVHHRRHS